MEDSKRLILALAISAAVMMFYSVFMAPEPKEQAQKTTTTTLAQAPAAPAAPPAAAPAAPPAGAPVPAGQAVMAPPAAKTAAPSGPASTDIVVDTPLFKAWFSTRGGTLRKFVLKEYYEKADQQGGNFILLDLPAKDRFSLGFNIAAKDEHLDLRQFKANVDKVVLNRQGQTAELVFSAVSAGFAVEKIYRFRADGYDFGLEVRVTNQNSAPVEMIGEMTLVEIASKSQINSYAFTGIEAWQNKGLVEMDPGDLEEKPVQKGDITWMSMNIPYFMGAVAPLSSDNGDKRALRGDMTNGVMKGTMVEPAVTMAPGQSASAKYMVFYGPRDLEVIKPLGHQLERAVDFGWFDILAKPFLTVMNFLYGYVGNYGIAIIIITLLVKIIFWPLTAKSYKSMKKMQQLSPQIAKVREKYKGDKQRMNQEVMQMYKTYKVNPMGGCLPMVVQIPVFIAFYKVLGNSIELRHAPFWLWMNDLSAPDRLPIGFDIPYVGAGLPVLTLLMGASMFVQQKMTPTTGDPTQAKMMMLMPVVFTVMFINFPSGLVLYWLTNNLLSIGQQYYTNKKK